METPATVLINLPESFSSKEARQLARELKSKITESSPCVVLDLSRVRQMDSKGLEALLACMDEVAKCDGAIQLRAVSAEAAILLELTRIDQILQKFPSFNVEAPVFELTPEPVAAEASADASVQLPVAA
jgi:anti-anti-sigma factor